VNWARVEEEVGRLRQRIFTAARAGEHRKVRSLQRLMLRSRANALLSTRRVAQVNQGRRTAGIDGRTALSGSNGWNWPGGSSSTGIGLRLEPSVGSTSPRETVNGVRSVSP
jgi:N-terminal domain of reverse transcriptase